MHAFAEDQADIGQVIEDNVLALLDTNGVKNIDDIEDDKMSYIEAVHALCVVGRQAKPPTWKVHEAVFKILEENASMELNMASYSLLLEIAQLYPQVAIIKNASTGKKDLVFNKKIYTPFYSEPSDAGEKRSRISTRHANPLEDFCDNFTSILKETKDRFTQDLSGDVSQKNDARFSNNHKVIGIMLKYKYLFSIIECDFKCRVEAYKDSKDKEVVCASYILQLFEEASRKDLIMLLLDLILLSDEYMKRLGEVIYMQDFSSSIQALIEMRILLEIESQKLKNANSKRGRLDVSRSQPVFDQLRDNIYYHDRFEDLLQVMEDSDLKIRIIFSIFVSCIPKPLAKAKIRDQSSMSVEDMLDCLKDPNSAKKVYNCMASSKLQVLVAIAVKVHLRQIMFGKNATCTSDLCASLKTTFENFKNISGEFAELHQVAKQALMTAETLIALSK